MIWGEDDTALVREMNDGLERLVPDLHIHYVPGCAHWVQQEAPELVNGYLRGFLNEV